MEDLTVLSPRGELDAYSWRSWLPPRCLLVENYCLLVDNFSFRLVSDVTIGLLVFFFSGGLVRTFSSSSARSFRQSLDAPLGPISLGWFQRYGRNSLPKLRSEFMIHKNLLWFFVFIVFMLCLFATFIGRLLYWLFLTLRSEFYCILFYNDLFLPTLRSDFLVGHPLGGPVWSIVFFDQSSRCCRFTGCHDITLPHDCDRTSIE